MRGIVLFSVVFFLSCTQEHLLLLKNIQNAQFLSFEQILDESGYTKYINRPKPVTNQLPPVADVMTTNQVSLVVILKTNFIPNTSPALNGQTIVTQVVTLPVDPAKTIQSNKIITQKYSSYVDYMFAWSATPDCNSADPSLYIITGISDAEYPNFKLDFDHSRKPYAII